MKLRFLIPAAAAMALASPAVAQQSGPPEGGRDEMRQMRPAPEMRRGDERPAHRRGDWDNPCAREDGMRDMMRMMQMSMMYDMMHEMMDDRARGPGAMEGRHPMEGGRPMDGRGMMGGGMMDPDRGPESRDERRAMIASEIAELADRIARLEAMLEAMGETGEVEPAE